MTTSDPVEKVFLADLNKDASDHTTRKIYADWLEEQGRIGEAEVERWIASRTYYIAGRFRFYRYCIPIMFCNSRLQLHLDACTVHDEFVSLKEAFQSLQKVARYLYSEGKWKPS